MGKQAKSDASARQTVGSGRSWFGWWLTSVEPVLLTVLLVLGSVLVLLALLEVLPLRTSLRALLVLAWLAGALLLVRLPRLLRRERYRVALISAMGVATLLFGSLAQLQLFSSSTAEHVEAAELAAAISALERGMAGDLEAGAGNGLGAAPRSPLTFVSPPRISREAFTQVLKRGAGAGTSPAAPFAEELYEIILGYGLDPAVALAFFAHESQLCQTGVCRNYDTKGWGGQRAAYNPRRAVGVVRGQSGPFVRYRTWQDGLRDWCELILYRYVKRGLDTVEEAVPVYAPTSDGNVPTSYIAAVRRMVSVWQGRDNGTIRSRAARVYRSEDLQTALLMESFRAIGLEYHPEWAFHRYALAEAHAGRPLGSPLDESRRITVGSQQYAVQTFALDTLYTPLAQVEAQTNWNDVRRLSDLLKQAKSP